MKKCNTCAKFKELDQFKHYNLTNSCGYSRNCLNCIKNAIATTKKVRKLACLDTKYRAKHEALNIRHQADIDQINNQ